MAYGRGLRASRGLSYASVEQAAKNLRRILQISPDERIPHSGKLFENLEDHHIRIGGKSFGLTYGVSEGLLTEAQAELQPEIGRIVIQVNEETYAGLEQDSPRPRFSVCHEVGHVVLHVPELVKLSRMPHKQAALLRDTAAPHPAYLDTEWQANAFAAAFLMPAQALREMEKSGNLSSSYVQRELGVSFSAASTRIDVYRERRQQLLS